MTMRVTEYPYSLLRLVLLQRRAQGASSLGLHFEVVDLQVQVRLHLLSTRALWPSRGPVVRFQLEAEAGAFRFRSPQADPVRLAIDFLPAKQSPVEVGEDTWVGRTENQGTERRRHALTLPRHSLSRLCLRTEGAGSIRRAAGPAREPPPRSASAGAADERAGARDGVVIQASGGGLFRTLGACACAPL